MSFSMSPEFKSEYRLLRAVELIDKIYSNPFSVSGCPSIPKEKRTREDCFTCGGSGKTWAREFNYKNSIDRKNVIYYRDYQKICDQCGGTGMDNQTLAGKKNGHR